MDFVIPDNVHPARRTEIIERMEEADVNRLFHEFATEIIRHIHPNVLRSVTSES